MATGLMAGKRGLFRALDPAYQLSDLAGGVSGEIHYGDAGFSVVGMTLPDNATPEASE